MITKPILVILAAGIGNRYGGLKQMDPIGPNNQCLIDYAIYDAKLAGFEDVIFIIKKEIEDDFKSMIGDRISKKINVEYAYQELDDLPEGFIVPEGRTKPWGTAHALICASKLIAGPFAVINADDYYGPEPFKKIYDFLINNNDYRTYCMVGWDLINTLSDNGGVTRGVCNTSIIDNHEYLIGITDYKGVKKYENDLVMYFDEKSISYIVRGTTASMNFFGFQRSFIDEAIDRFPRFLDKLDKTDSLYKEFSIPVLLDDLLSYQLVKTEVIHTDSKWMGVTYRKDRPFVEQEINKMTTLGLYPENLWE